MNLVADARMPKNVVLLIGGAVLVAGIVWTAIAFLQGGEVIKGRIRWDAATGQWVTEMDERPS